MVLWSKYFTNYNEMHGFDITSHYLDYPGNNNRTTLNADPRNHLHLGTSSADKSFADATFITIRVPLSAATSV